MTASERANQLIDLLIERVAMKPVAVHLHLGNQAEDGIKRTKAQLLAYVARLEACVDAARHAFEVSVFPTDAITKERLTREAMNRLHARLAALDRPEDGE